MPRLFYAHETRDQMANPLQNVTLDITDLGSRGEGIAHHEDERIFVPFTLPGETITAEVNGNRGIMHDLRSSAVNRVPAFCPHFGTCGGCQLQHLDKTDYQSWKRQLLITALNRVGLDPEIAPLIDASGEGRRRATLHGRRTGAGFNKLRSHDIAPIDQCPILVPALSKAPKITSTCFDILGDCDVAFTATANGMDVAVRAKKHNNQAALTKIAATYNLARLTLNGETVIINRPPEIKVATATVRLPTLSFLQATAAAETVMAKHIVAAATGAKRVADLFCGVGPFALHLAPHAKTFAVDSDKNAVVACEAALRGTPGLKVIGTEVRDLARDPLTVKELKTYDAVVFDPPRAGAQAQATELATSKVKTIIAVSCDPTSFARDAAILVAGGYKIESVTPIDQFIWSAHLETVAVFKR